MSPFSPRRRIMPPRARHRTSLDPSDLYVLAPFQGLTITRELQPNGLHPIESAYDFVLTQETKINSATFTGLLTGIAPSIGNVVVEIYRVFPADSDVGRTSGPPTFSTPNVPTRVNSPSAPIDSPRAGHRR